jgi:hypothetical protein
MQADCERIHVVMEASHRGMVMKPGYQRINTTGLNLEGVFVKPKTSCKGCPAKTLAVGL